MRISADTNIKKRFEKRYWRLTRKVLVKCREQVVYFSQHTDPERLRGEVERLLLIKPMLDHIISLWMTVGGKTAFDTENKINRKKSAVPDMEFKADQTKKLYWDEKLKKYASERSLIKAQAILTTEQEAINKVIDSVIQESADQGLGIIETRKLLTHDLEGEQMLEMENWQAQRIAMTEVGSAQNTGSFMAAQENSEGVNKVWMFIPGMKSFREEHQQFGADDEASGGRAMDEEYAPGLQYPGDPNGGADQTINCYCSVYYETKE